MKLRLNHTAYIAKRISTALEKNQHINIVLSSEDLLKRIQEVLDYEIGKEELLDTKVESMIDNMSDDVVDEFEYMDVNYKQVFWMAKKKLAKEYEFILDVQDRYNHISHEVILELDADGVIDYNVSEIILKNIVYDAIIDFICIFKEIQEEITEKISHYKRKLIPGTEDYDLIYNRLYEESLVRKGLM
jgi:hypothetical protein